MRLPRSRWSLAMTYSFWSLRGVRRLTDDEAISYQGLVLRNAIVSLIFAMTGGI
ncbi:hypothetical protein KAX35_09350 [candidate division WOR-3 bacterium]|nr:hypothetical protein [candidate division WOR-3 bacterium]